jgi:hypothetical protein
VISHDVVIDACSTLNLLATGHAVDIVRAVGFKLLIPDGAAEEVRYLVGPRDAEGSCPEIPADLSPLSDQGMLRIIPSRELSTDALIEIAAQLTDVDALGVVLARQLGRPLMSDDGKVRRVFREFFPGGELHSTLQIVRRATTLLRYSDSAVREILRTMRHAGNFEPPRLDPEREWFKRYLIDD